MGCLAVAGGFPPHPLTNSQAIWLWISHTHPTSTADLLQPACLFCCSSLVTVSSAGLNKQSLLIKFEVINLAV